MSTRLLGRPPPGRRPERHQSRRARVPTPGSPIRGHRPEPPRAAPDPWHGRERCPKRFRRPLPRCARARTCRVDLCLPCPKARAGPRAHGASLDPVGAVLGAPVGIHFPRSKGVLVVVHQDIVGTGDHAAGATGAESRGHDLFVEMDPMQLLGGHRPTVVQGSGGPGEHATPKGTGCGYPMIFAKL